MAVSIIQTIDAESLAFAKEFIIRRKAALAKRKTEASGELDASLDFELTKQATSEAATLFFMFAEQGRFIDMRQKSFKYDRIGKSMIDNIEDWIQKKGLLQKMVNGWLKNRGQTTTAQDYEKIRRSIAWGIAVNRKKGIFKRKPWWNKAKTAGITDLVNNVAAALPSSASEQIIDRLISALDEDARRLRGGSSSYYAKAKGR